MLVLTHFFHTNTRTRTHARTHACQRAPTLVRRRHAAEEQQRQVEADRQRQMHMQHQGRGGKRHTDRFTTAATATPPHHHHYKRHRHFHPSFATTFVSRCFVVGFITVTVPTPVRLLFVLCRPGRVCCAIECSQVGMGTPTPTPTVGMPVPAYLPATSTRAPVRWCQVIAV